MSKLDAKDENGEAATKLGFHVPVNTFLSIMLVAKVSRHSPQCWRESHKHKKIVREMDRNYDTTERYNTFLQACNPFSVSIRALTWV